MPAGLKTQIVSLLATLLASAAPVLAHTQFENQSDLGRDLRVPVHHWFDNEQNSRAIIVAMPGLVFNGRAYELPSRQLVEKGYEVYAADMRGYGDWKNAKNLQLAGDAAIHFGKSKDDVTAILKKLRASNPSKPIFIMGESFGANMAMWQAADQPDLVDGVIAVSLPYRMYLNPNPRWFVTAAQMMRHPLKPLKLTPYLIPTLSEDKSVSEAAMSDANTAVNEMSVVDLLKARWTMRCAMARVGAIRKDCPVLVVAGGRDHVQRTSTLPTVVAAMGSHEAKLVVFAKKGHLLLERKSLEPNVLDEVNGWLETRMQEHREAIVVDLGDEPVVAVSDKQTKVKATR